MLNSSDIIQTYQQLLEYGYMSETPGDIYRERPLYQSTISTVESGPITSIRTPQIAGQISQDYHSFIVLTSGFGYWINEQGDTPLLPGSILFIKASNRFTFHFPVAYRALSFNVPIEMLLQYFRTPPNHGAVICSGTSEIVETLEYHLAQTQPMVGGVSNKSANSEAQKLEAQLMGNLRQHYAFSHTPCVSLETTVKGLIKAHAFDEEFSIDWLADRCNASRRYLFKLFEGKNLSLNRYIQKTQLSHAFELLTDRDQCHLQVGDIAIQCGFKTQAHFSRLFKQRYQITPRALRNTLETTADYF